MVLKRVVCRGFEMPLFFCFLANNTPEAKAGGSGVEPPVEGSKDSVLTSGFYGSLVVFPRRLFEDVWKPQMAESEVDSEKLHKL